MTKIPFEARYAFQFILLAIFFNVKLIHLSECKKYCTIERVFKLNYILCCKIINCLTYNIESLIISLPITNYQLPITN